VKFGDIALGIAVSAGLVAAISSEAKSVPEEVVSVGYRKYGNLILLKGREELDNKLAPLGSMRPI
jgi:hypothetical protein